MRKDPLGRLPNHRCLSGKPLSAFPLFLAGVFLLLPATPGTSQEPSVRDWIGKLAGPQALERERAANALGALKAKEAVEDLVRRLVQDPEPLVRRAAARALGAIGDVRAMKALCQSLLTEGDSGVVQDAVEAARALDRKGAVKQVTSALFSAKTPHAQRMNAVQALLRMPEASSTAALLQASLGDEFMAVRARAIEGAKAAPERPRVLAFYLSALGGGNHKERARAAFALGEIGDLEARPALLKTGLAPEARILFESLQALAKLPHPDSVPYLLSVWQAEEKHPDVRMAAVHALAETGDKRAIPVLRWAIENDDWFLRTLGALGLGKQASDPEVSKYLYEGLAKAKGDRTLDFVNAVGLSGDPAAVAPLAKAARAGELKVAVTAIEGLTRIGNEAARDVLAELLDDSRVDIRALAANRLGVLKHGKAAGKIRKMLEEREFAVQMEAAKALGRLQDPAAVPGLIRLCKETKSEGLRAVAAQALGDINPALGDSPALRESLAVLFALLKDPDVLVRGAAVGAIEGAECRESVDALLDAWMREGNSFVAHSILQALRSLTKQDLPGDPDAWKTWWGQARERFGAEKRPQEVSAPAFQVYLKELRRKGLDLVFALDVTGSMGEELREAQQRTGDIIRILRRIIPSLRVGFVAFDDDVRPPVGPLSFDYDQTIALMAKHEASGGGDVDESIGLAFQAALRDQAWRDEARKVIVLVGDAGDHEPRKLELLAFLAHRGMGVEFSCIEAHTTDVVQLPDFVAVAVQGGGQVVRLEETRDLLRHLVVSALGPAWRAEAERVVAALFE